MKTCNLKFTQNSNPFFTNLACNVHAWTKANLAALQPFIAYKKQGFKIYLAGEDCFRIGTQASPALPVRPEGFSLYLERPQYANGAYNKICDHYNCVKHGYGKFSYMYNGLKIWGRPIGGLWWKGLPENYADLLHVSENLIYLQNFYHEAVAVELFSGNAFCYTDPMGLAEASWSRRKIELLPHRKTLVGKSEKAMRYMAKSLNSWQEDGFTLGKRLKQALHEVEIDTGAYTLKSPAKTIEELLGDFEFKTL